MVGKMVVDPLGAVRVALPVLTSVPMAGVIKLAACNETHSFNYL